MLSRIVGTFSPPFARSKVEDYLMSLKPEPISDGKKWSLIDGVVYLGI